MLGGVDHRSPDPLPAPVGRGGEIIEPAAVPVVPDHHRAYDYPGLLPQQDRGRVAGLRKAEIRYRIIVADD